MSAANHLPPEALNQWLAEAAEDLGLEAGEVDIATILNIARDVAHNVARPAAPLTTFLVGLAVGRAAAAGADPVAELAARAASITELALSKAPTE